MLTRFKVHFRPNSCIITGKDFSKKQMQSLGVRLRLERQRQKIGIEKIAEATCISQRYLEAIEADDQSSLPGEFFYRAFVRQYSKYLGWDPDEIEKQINMVSSLPSADPVETPSVSSGNLSLNKDQQITALRETLKDKPIRPAQDDGSPKAWFAFAALVIVGCIGYFAWRNFTPSPAATTETASAPVKPMPEPPPVQKQEVAPQTPTPVTETPKSPEPTPVTTAALPPAAGKFALTIRAKETTWIRLIADGAKIYGGTLDAGQERTINAASAELIVGNAGTLDVLYNGKPLTYGSKGEVKTLLMNPEGWKFKPKPPPEPATTPAASTSGDAAPASLAPRAL
jgi:cytoskeletal protein RodZ